MKFAIFVSVVVSQRCGPGYGRCTTGNACSPWNYCGSTSAYTLNCQPAYSDSALCPSSSAPAVPIIPQWQTCPRGSTNCAVGNICCLATADLPNNKYTCRPRSNCDAGALAGTTPSPSPAASSTAVSPPGPTQPVPPTTPVGNSRTTCGQNGGSICASGLCCSQYGWCGNSDQHCYAGCQRSFGACKGALQTDNSVRSGRLTFYFQQGRGGACDGRVRLDSDIVCSMSTSIAQCNRNGIQTKIEVTVAGRTQICDVVDQCAELDGCVPGTIDASIGFWNAVGLNFGTGVYPITWRFV